MPDTKVHAADTKVSAIPEREWDLLQGEVVPLSQTAVLLRAPLFKDESSAGGKTFKILSVVDIKEYGHTARPGKSIRINAFLQKAEKYRLKPFDVVISIVGTIGRICIVSENAPDNWLPTSNMLIIRFKEDRVDNALAFAMFMHSPHGERILKSLTHGTKIAMISKKEFSKIGIPALTPEIRKQAQYLYMQEEKLAHKIEECLGTIRSLRGSYLQTHADMVTV